MWIKIIDIDNVICPLPLFPITCTGWGSCIMDMTGMVLISLLGYRTDSGFDLKYLGLCRLTVVGWGHQQSRPGDSGGLALSWPFSDCCQVPGSTRSRALALRGKTKGQFTAAAFVSGIRNGSTEGSLHPKFYSE